MRIIHILFCTLPSSLALVFQRKFQNSKVRMRWPLNQWAYFKLFVLKDLVIVVEMNGNNMIYLYCFVLYLTNELCFSEIYLLQLLHNFCVYSLGFIKIIQTTKPSIRKLQIRSCIKKLCRFHHYKLLPRVMALFIRAFILEVLHLVVATSWW